MVEVIPAVAVAPATEPIPAVSKPRPVVVNRRQTRANSLCSGGEMVSEDGVVSEFVEGSVKCRSLAQSRVRCQPPNGGDILQRRLSTSPFVC